MNIQDQLNSSITELAESLEKAAASIKQTLEQKEKVIRGFRRLAIALIGLCCVELLVIGYLLIGKA